MGKRDTRVAFVNPIAAARSSGQSQSGTSIKDYLSRPRPLWDELKEMIKSKRKGSRTLEQFEQRMNKEHRAELDRERDSLLNAEKPQKRKREHLSHVSSPSLCAHSSSMTSSSHSKSGRQYKKRKMKSSKDRITYKRRRRYDENSTTTEWSDESEWEEVQVKIKTHKKKKREEKKCLQL